MMHLVSLGSFQSLIQLAIALNIGLMTIGAYSLGLRNRAVGQRSQRLQQLSAIVMRSRELFRQAESDTAKTELDQIIKDATDDYGKISGLSEEKFSGEIETRPRLLLALIGLSMVLLLGASIFPNTEVHVLFGVCFLVLLLLVGIRAFAAGKDFIEFDTNWRKALEASEKNLESLLSKLIEVDEQIFNLKKNSE
ncbi:MULTISPECIES: hypothetical protein [unclassified Hyphomonas]|jgi:ABC-type multidrug transport system fused ATPase/permease subunit|uniref:hypothetical protein n=1 Tax=unclassified Hyphomonas TaxID=2630699 RepID=UPI000C4F7894|nr:MULTISPECIES: hypothetical protein [unclassified Hyphomonas]MAN66003.1 hypothetical protein [Hyphomonadaceae bacterium]|tara:strand:+ start:489 stop:1070 length:582 start_codon:yes stop_codon:yes gene_type:complete